MSDVRYLLAPLGSTVPDELLDRFEDSPVIVYFDEREGVQGVVEKLKGLVGDGVFVETLITTTQPRTKTRYTLNPLIETQGGKRMSTPGY